MPLRGTAQLPRYLKKDKHKHMNVVLDTNIYDTLTENPEYCTVIRTLIESGLLSVIVTRTVVEELFRSPFNGIPDFFPTSYELNTVSRAGIMKAGDRLGRGDVYCSHLGDSKKVNDALIADAAAVYADYLVSDDYRLRKRMQSIESRCKPLSFNEFLQVLETIAGNESLQPIAGRPGSG